ncbi:hypothetical protein AAFC00_005480 [Neodothiora populina]
MVELYALSECKDYLSQKESLVQMNFQLIAIKESLDVEKLTRAAFLISKVTVLFVPLSFMTSYFSLDLDMKYDARTYWTTFAIVLVLSSTVLVAFGLASGTLMSWKRLSGIRRLTNWVKRIRRADTAEAEQIHMDPRRVESGGASIGGVPIAMKEQY